MANTEELVGLRIKHFLPTPPLYYKTPIQLTKAKGCTVWDETGREYLDVIGGILCISSGHNHPKIKNALLKIIEDDIIQHTSLLYVSEYVVDTAKALTDVAPDHLSKVSFTNSGSEANELAMMTARHATGENFVVNLRHGYHGGTSGTLAQCGHYNWRFKSQPVSHVTSAEAPYCYRCPFSQKPESCKLECAQNVETTIQTSTHGKIAAFIAEPIMGVGGFLDAPKEYFEKVIDIVHKYGGKYISDEVQTGAGRCGEEFLYTKELGIKADMITMAKGFGNGAAVGAVLMTTDCADPLAGKAYFNTFGGDPYQMLQAKINMDIIKEEKLIQNSKNMGKRFKDGLNQLKNDFEIIGDVRGRGLMLGVEVVKDKTSKTYAPDETTQIMELCKDKGLLIGKGGLLGNILRIAPPLSITEKEVDKALGVLAECLKEVSK